MAIPIALIMAAGTLIKKGVDKANEKLREKGEKSKPKGGIKSIMELREKKEAKSKKENKRKKENDINSKKDSFMKPKRGNSGYSGYPKGTAPKRNY